VAFCADDSENIPPARKSPINATHLKFIRLPGIFAPRQVTGVDYKSQYKITLAPTAGAFPGGRNDAKLTLDYPASVDLGARIGNDKDNIPAVVSARLRYRRPDGATDPNRDDAIGTYILHTWPIGVQYSGRGNLPASSAVII